MGQLRARSPSPGPAVQQPQQQRSHVPLIPDTFVQPVSGRRSESPRPGPRRQVRDCSPDSSVDLAAHRQSPFTRGGPPTEAQPTPVVQEVVAALQKEQRAFKGIGTY